MIKYYFFFLFSLFFLSQCREKEILGVNYGGEELILKRTYYSNGIVKAERTFKEDGDKLVPWGYAKLFSSKGELEYFANFIDDTTKVGDAFEYWDNKKPKKYWFYDPLGRGIYGSEYNREGSIILEKGDKEKKPRTVISKTNSSLVVGDTLFFEIYYMDPPHLSISEIKIRNGNGEWSRLPKFKPYTKFEDVMTLSGINKYEIQVEYYSADSSYTVKDSLNIFVE